MSPDNGIEAPKTTSWQYGDDYQRRQAGTFRQRHSNQWKPRMALVHELIDTHVLPRFGVRAPRSIVTLDVGCSIGTIAIEMALRGFTAHGVDFDASALAIARELAAEEGVQVEWHLGDVAQWQPAAGGVDIALCFDIFEHLHDDELGALLQGIRRHLSEQGALVFHTFPLQYDYLFFSHALANWPLRPFTWLPAAAFERLARAYAALLDAGLLLGTGRSYKERIRKAAHCNTTTRSRLLEVLEQPGYAVSVIETANLYRDKPHVARWFGHQPVAHRNLYGVAVPRR